MNVSELYSVLAEVANSTRKDLLAQDPTTNLIGDTEWNDIGIQTYVNIMGRVFVIRLVIHEEIPDSPF